MGTMDGAATPAEGYRELVSRKGVGGKVHTVEVAGGTPQRVGAEAEGAGVEEESEGDEVEGQWVDQSGWGNSNRRGRWRRCLLEEQEEEPMVEGGAEEEVKQTVKKLRTLQEKTASDESFEKRQMLWKGMSGKGWSAMVQQWGAPEVEPLQLQKSIAVALRLGVVIWILNP